MNGSDSSGQIRIRFNGKIYIFQVEFPAIPENREINKKEIEFFPS